MEPNVPERIGKYEILSELGRGGMGVVYKALNRRMAMQVAIKTVSQDYTADARMLENFYREAQKTAMLRHPNIITIYDVGDQDGAPYIVMEYLPGESLQSMIDDRRPLPLLEKLQIVEQLCSALGYAHQNDVIHRDVKPANVIVQPSGVIKLLDFGIARQENRSDVTKTQAGKVKGTVPYMSPEQLKGGELDGRCDIFATGVLLFQFLTGVLPFDGEFAVIINRILTDHHPPLGNFLPDYPPMIDAILDRALAKNPGERYSTAEEMGADIFTVVDGLKREHIASMIAGVKDLIAEEQFIRARETLLSAQKLDPQHSEVRSLLSEVNLSLGRRQREEKTQQLVTQAKDLLRERNFDRAVEMLEEAARSVPDDRFVAALLEDARKEKARREQLEGLLRQAQAARDQGNLKTAILFMDRALVLDEQDARVRQLHQALSRQAEEAQQRETAREMVEQARAKLRIRRFQDAIHLLRKAEELDQLQPDLQSLRAAAEAGLAEEERRAVLENMESRAGRAETQEDVAETLAMVEMALNQFRDPALFRLQAELTRRLREFEARALVDKTIQECQALLETAPAEALERVNSVLLQLPAEDRLLVLQARIREHLVRMDRDRQRNAYLEQAHRALKNREYREAVRVLEACQGELMTHEISELLRFARREAQQQEQQDLIAATLAHANQLLLEEDYEAAIAYMEPLLAEANEPGLRAVLDQARSRLEAVTREAAAALKRVEPWAASAAHSQVIATLEILAPAVQRVPAVAEALRNAREAHDSEVRHLLQLGFAYGSLASRNPAAEWSPLPGPAAGDPRSIVSMTASMIASMQSGLVLRRAQVAGAALEKYSAEIEKQLDAGGYAPAGRWIAAHVPVFPFLDAHTREKWEGLRERARLKKSPNTGLRGANKAR
jgi:serine/threonine-protein kinase